MSDTPQLDLEIFDEDATAKALRRSPRTLTRWRRNGTGPKFVLLGRQPFYRRESLNAWLAEREHCS